MLALNDFPICLLFVGLGFLIIDAAAEINDRFYTDTFFSQPEAAKAAQNIVSRQRKIVKAALAAGFKEAAGGNTDIKGSKNLDFAVMPGNKIQNEDPTNKIHEDLENGGHVDYSKKVDGEGRVRLDWDVDVPT